jgi:hypothetical protein
MIAAMPQGAQRWNDRRDSYRPAGEPIRTADFDVVEILSDNVARAFVERHHYSGSYPAARARFGLYRRGELVGVAVFSHPCNDRVLTGVFPQLTPTEAVELGRFVLLDEVPGNGESWMLARCFELLRGRVAGVVSFSDPIPRTKRDGSAVFPGHVGTIYQALNARFLGRGKADTLRLLPDGRAMHRRARSKIRNLERGWEAAAEQLVAFGASPVDVENPAAWLDRWLAELTRPLRHPGNLRYAWGLERRIARALPASLPYPKARDVIPLAA